MCSWLQEEFEINKLEPTDVVAHRLQIGQGIGVHNDRAKSREAIRLMLQLNDHNVVGGELALFRDHSPDSVCRTFKPVHGTAVAFEISNISYHAVARVAGGHRYTVIYSFRS